MVLNRFKIAIAHQILDLDWDCHTSTLRREEKGLKEGVISYLTLEESRYIR
jgi:hypothetical protein